MSEPKKPHPWMTETVHTLWATPQQGGDAGIEIELEGDNLPIKIKGWVAKHENSLRGRNGRAVPEFELEATDRPWEYVTNGAMTRQQLWAALVDLSNALELPGIEIRKPARTSTHIHVNMQKRTLRELFGYILVHTITEPMLLRLCGPERNGNLFCLPNAETPDLHSTISKWVSSIRANSNYWDRRGKYACLNTDPLMTLGSVETRCFPASTNADELFKWVTWVLNIRDVATTWSDFSYASLLDEAYFNPLDFAARIFSRQPDLGLAAFPQTVSELIRFGVEVAHEAHVAMQPVFFFDGKKKRTKKKEKDWQFGMGVNAATIAQPHMPDPVVEFLDEELL